MAYRLAVGDRVSFWEAGYPQLVKQLGVIEKLFNYTCWTGEERPEKAVVLLDEAHSITGQDRICISTIVLYPEKERGGRSYD